LLPTAATVTAVTAAPPTAAAFSTAVTGLAPQATFVTATSGGGEGGDATLAPALGQPAAPVDGNPAPGPDNPTPMPATPDAGAPGAVPGDFGGALAGDAADEAVAFGWDEGEYATLPDSGTAVAALLMSLGYCGASRTPRREEDERRRDWLAC
jgi:hypothetical protein